MCDRPGLRAVGSIRDCCKTVQLCNSLCLCLCRAGEIGKRPQLWALQAYILTTYHVSSSSDFRRMPSSIAVLLLQASEVLFLVPQLSVWMA